MQARIFMRRGNGEAMELWDVYDVNRRKTGETMVRGSAYAQGAYHLVVHICIFNDKGEMLIQQRQPFKEGWSNLWDVTVGGSAVCGDDSQSAAERELAEELGLHIDLHGIRPHLSITFDHGFDDIYLIERNVDLSELKLQYEEVQNARWASMEEILSMIDNGEFIPYYPHLIRLLFEMHLRHYGAIMGDL